MDKIVTNIPTVIVKIIYRTNIWKMKCYVIRIILNINRFIFGKLKLSSLCYMYREKNIRNVDLDNIFQDGWNRRFFPYFALLPTNAFFIKFFILYSVCFVCKVTNWNYTYPPLIPKAIILKYTSFLGKKYSCVGL